MMSSKSTRLALALTTALGAASLSVHAAGFAMYETSARGNAMGGALVGLTDDASAVYNNPANLVDLPGVQTMLGTSIILPTSKQDLGPLGKHRLDDQIFAPPHAYVSWQLTDRWWFGFGEFSRFGLGTRFADSWPGRNNSLDAKLETLSLNPNLAYKISDELSVAAGLEAMYMDIRLEKSMLPYPLPTVPLRLKGDSWGYGGNFAVSWKPAKDLGLGLVYRLPIHQRLEGDATTDGITLPQPYPTIPPQNCDVKGEVVLPASLTFGANYKPTDRLNLGLAVTYTEWSSYDQLAMRFNPPLNGTIASSAVQKNWRNVFRFGFGAEYKLTESLAVQGSYIYDMDPISDEHSDYILPPGDRHILGTGLGYTLGTWTLNAGYSLLLMDTVTFSARPAEGVPSDTKSEFSLAHMFAVSVGKKF